MQFLIADSFTDSLSRLNGEEQKAVKTTAFDLQMNPANPGMNFHRLDKARPKTSPKTSVPHIHIFCRNTILKWTLCGKAICVSVFLIRGSVSFWWIERLFAPESWCRWVCCEKVD